MRLSRLLIVAGATLIPAVVSAESVYVIDKLLVGVHQEKSVDSDIIKVIPTGTLLEVVERDGDLVLIRDPDGVTGWVDGSYLMKDRPAALQIGDLEDRTRQLQAELADALGKLQDQQTHAAAGQTVAGDIQTEELQRQAEDLEKRLSSERLRSGELEARLRDAEAHQRETQAELDALREANSQLVEAMPPATPERGASAAGEDLSLVELAGNRTVHIIGAVVLVLLVCAFGGGVYFMDFINRRRHGGFRI
jgi:SH3 domain protein